MARDPFTHRNYPDQQMHDYGGGGGSSTSPNKRYFYLVVKSDQQAPDTLDSKDVQKFFKTGVNSDEGYLFSFIDISSDHRLKADLLKMQNGPEFYEKLSVSTPAFLITYVPIPEIVGTSVIKLCPIKNYETDVQVIYDEMGLAPPSARNDAIAFLRAVNRYVQLKPNVLGLGANLNDLISDLITRLERNSP
jgi:hypothetical protein